ncbi:hypothetical protein GCM10027299_08290 [Larkinella ripae]
MKIEKKSLSHEIAQSVKTQLNGGAELSKKVKKTIDQSAEKLAEKVMKIRKKEEKKKSAEPESKAPVKAE